MAPSKKRYIDFISRQFNEFLYFSNDIQLINRISVSGAIIPGFWLRL